ncbi:MAG: CRISPR-associated protein Cas4 [Halanaerobiales bacterium]
MDIEYYQWEKINSIPISALQHYIYCPRQFSLIHIEEIYEENIFTIQGNIVHKRVDEAKNYYNKDKVVENSLPIWSERLGIYGIADIVEFKNGNPLPVEFKSGKKKNKLADDIQLTAQAFCLEEMFNVVIEKGYIYYDKSRQRREVQINKRLRTELGRTVQSCRDLLLNRKVPAPANDNRCTNCSLKEFCLPDLKEKADKICRELLK